MRRLALLLALIVIALLAWLAFQRSDPEATNGAGHSTEVAIAAEFAPESVNAKPVAEKPPRVREHAVVSRPEEREPQEAETAKYMVRVLDQHDVPVPGVSIRLGTNLGNDPPAKLTRSDGSAQWDVETRASEVTIKSPLFEPVVLQDRETVVRLGDLLPLEICFVDQESCRPVGVWIQGSPLETDDVLSNQLVTSYEPRAAPIRGGREAILKVWFHAPDGYVVVRRPGFSIARDAVVSRYATSVRTTVPVAHELKLTARVLRHDGTPAEGAVAAATATGATAMSAAETVGATGDARISGLPFLRGERVLVYARDAEGRTSPTAEELLVDADRELIVTVRLPAEPPDSIIGIGGSSSSSFSGRPGRRRQPEGTARLTLTVSRRNGLPAAGALVLANGPANRSGRADDSGRVEFDRLPAGKYHVIMREPGLVCASTDVELADGESRTMALLEPQGRDATVRVLDADGLPLPNVLVQVDLPWGERHVQVTDGVQDLDHWTDLSGRVRFTDLPGGILTIVAIHGSRRVNAPLEGDSAQVTIPNR